jgi:hypothetical protein
MSSFKVFGQSEDGCLVHVYFALLCPDYSKTPYLFEEIGFG